MDLNKPQTIEELVLKELSKKALTGETLLSACQNIKPGFTKQALYQLLRKLMDREIVVKHGKTFSLSQVWILKMNDFFSIVQKQYSIDERGGNDFLALGDGDKISYSFKSPIEADRFWGHAFNILVGTLRDDPLYIYNPHEWFFFARKESEEFLFKELKNKNQQVWLICGSNTELDKYVGRYFDGSVLQYYMDQSEIFEARNYYLNIFGDYIIEARIDEKVAEKVDRFFNENKVVTEKTSELLTKLLDQGKTNLTISRNKKKAEKLKKLFTPYFYKI
ncbi:MAG: hypothetical protein KBC11_03050 [Candidatus Pacebacteria bacterium]|nr:hypothetical protein [Candidatus Paceibacterota bacterium]